MSYHLRWAEISLRLQMEAYAGPVNTLQPRIKAVSEFSHHNLAFDALVRYFVKVVGTAAYWRK
jgi:hypothetical protein